MPQLSTEVAPNSRKKDGFDAGAPPWIWVLAANYIIFSWRTLATQLLKAWKIVQDELPYQYASQSLAMLHWLLRSVLTLLDILSPLSIVVAMAIVAWFTLFRRAQSTRPLPNALPIPNEIAKAASGILPGVELSMRNATYPLMYVRPLGWRRCGLVLFRSFAVLWKRDAEAARALLEHEAVHQRRGDAQLIGSARLQRGLAFVSVAWLAVSMLFAAGFAVFVELQVRDYRAGAIDELPEWNLQSKRQGDMKTHAALINFAAREQKIAHGVRIASLKQKIVELRQMAGDDESLDSFALTENESRWSGIQNWNLRAIAAWTLMFIGQLVFLCAEFVSYLSFLIAAIWVAELQADRHAAMCTGGVPLMRSHSLLVPTGGWLTRLGAVFTHPPQQLRQWMASAPYKKSRLVALLLIYPANLYLFLVPLTLGLLVKIACDNGVIYVMSDSESTTDLRLLCSSLVYGLRSQTWLVLVTAGVVLVWPAICPLWERFFVGSTQVRALANYSAFALAASCIIAVAGLCQLL